MDDTERRIPRFGLAPEPANDQAKPKPAAAPNLAEALAMRRNRIITAVVAGLAVWGAVDILARLHRLVEAWLP